MLEVTLFHLDREDIRVDIVARFEGEALVIDGYDIGKKVEEYWGDSDYEYNMKIAGQGLHLLYAHFGVGFGKKEKLLQAIASQYNTNTCYSQLEDLLRRLNIQHESFRWT
jgi:hypothetical protein